MASISLKYKSKQGNLTAPGDVDPGAMIPLQTVTVGAGGVSNVDFTSIPQNYEHLQLRVSTRLSYAANYGTVYLRFNSDSNSNYVWHRLTGDGASASAGAGTSSTTIPAPLWGYPAANLGSSIFGVGIVDILDYTNTNKNTTVRSLGGYDANGSGQVHLDSGLWLNTSAITSLNLVFDNNAVQYSSFALYGIKRAGA